LLAPGFVADEVDLSLGEVVLALDALLIPAGRVELGVDELGACIGFVVQEQTYVARGVSSGPPSPRAGGRGPVLGQLGRGAHVSSLRCAARIAQRATRQ
jgi:hypothetical protein